MNDDSSGKRWVFHATRQGFDGARVQREALEAGLQAWTIALDENEGLSYCTTRYAARLSSADLLGTTLYPFKNVPVVLGNGGSLENRVRDSLGTPETVFLGAGVSVHQLNRQLRAFEKHHNKRYRVSGVR